jgi:hypothetical protein
MAIIRTNYVTTFDKITYGSPFSAVITLYTRSGGVEDPREYVFYKTGRRKAMTVDRGTVVHFLSNEKVNLCNMIKKKK